MNWFKRIWPYLRPYWLPAILAPLAMTLEVAMDLLQPKVLQQMVDIGIAQLDLHFVLQSGLLMLGLAAVGAVGGGGCTVAAVRASESMAADLRSALFRHVQALSFGNLDELETGKLITRLTNDVVQIKTMVADMLRMMVRAPLMLVGSLIMAIITIPSLSWLFLVLMPLVLGVLAWATIKARPMFTELQTRLDGVNTVMQENLSGVRVVKAFVQEEHEKERFGLANSGLMNQAITAMRLFAKMMPMMMMTINLGVVAVLWFGGIKINQGTVHIGALMAFINYLMTALRVMMMVAMVVMNISRAIASIDRVAEVLDAVPEVQDRADAQPLTSPKGRVVFDHVTFAYDGDEHEPALRDISFVAEPGETVAILGATGSGKSSLVGLIPRFYDVRQGRVTLDGVDVRDIAQDALRNHIGVALQEAVLFSGSIRDNIRYGRPDASDEQVVAAAKAAQAHAFILEMPQGYDTVVGQRGVNLSGGQKQRIAIARALLMEPTILILDDSTSAVDVETEAAIQEAQAEIMRGRTSLVIAQRISTVLNADKILVLEDGALAAEGTHEQLLSSSRIYREIFDSQLGNGVKANV
jgi:ATP-binding cassette subfamily B protein